MPSFNSDIRPLFRDTDIEEMQFAFNLGEYDDVKANAADIYAHLEEGSMPCDEPWPQEKGRPLPRVDGGGLPALACVLTYSNRGRIRLELHYGWHPFHIPGTRAPVCREQPSRCRGRVGVQGHRRHDAVVAPTRKERLHHTVEHDLPRQLNPGVVERNVVRGV